MGQYFYGTKNHYRHNEVHKADGIVTYGAKDENEVSQDRMAVIVLDEHQKVDHLSIHKAAIGDQFFKDSGSTYTTCSLDKDGNFDIAWLGDSPVYLTVNGKVIQLTMDMDAYASRYKNFVESRGGEILRARPGEPAYPENPRLGGDLEPLGAIGDSSLPDTEKNGRQYSKSGLIQTPERWSPSYTMKLNEFLKEKRIIGEKEDIRSLLKKEKAHLVVATDFLAHSDNPYPGIDNSYDPNLSKSKQCPYDYRVELTSDIELDENDDIIPNSKISFVASNYKDEEGKKNYAKNLLLHPKDKDNLQFYIDNALNRFDDMTLTRLNPGNLVVCADGHGASSEVAENVTSEEFLSKFVEVKKTPGTEVSAAQNNQDKIRAKL